MRRNKWKLAIASAIAFLMGFLTTLRSAPAQEPRFDMKVREDFFSGYAGDREALTRGMKACEDTLAKNPKEPGALVWHGGGLTFEAGEAFRAGDSQKGMDLWARGLKEMQTAIDLDDSVQTRIPRGAMLLGGASRHVPAGMAEPLIKDGLADFERTMVLQKDVFATLDTHSRGELLFGLAEGYSRIGNQEKARLYFEKIRQDLPKSVYAKRADTWMETKTLPADQVRCVGCH
jgi:hypothetical protein